MVDKLVATCAVLLLVPSFATSDDGRSRCEVEGCDICDEEVLRSLVRGDPMARGRVATAVQRGDKRAMAVLVHLLDPPGYDDASLDLRDFAADQLRNAGRPSEAVIRRYIPHLDWLARQAAGALLCSILCPSNEANKLIGCLADKRVEVRSEAADRLGSAGYLTLEPILVAVDEGHLKYDKLTVSIVNDSVGYSVRARREARAELNRIIRLSKSVRVKELARETLAKVAND